MTSGLGFLDALFETVHAVTTTGLSTTHTLLDKSKLILILAMAVGGSIGSTAGGIKVLRVLIVFRLLYLLINRAGAPSNAVSVARLNGRRLEAD